MLTFSIIMCILGSISCNYHHIDLLINLSDGILNLHKEASQKLKGNNAFQNNLTLILYDYKLLANKINKVERSLLQYDFLESGLDRYTEAKESIQSIQKKYAGIKDILDKLERIDVDKTVLPLKTGNFTDLQKFASNTNFLKKVLSLTSMKFEKQSMMQLALEICQHLTIIDIKAVFLNSFHSIITSTTYSIPDIANCKQAFLSLRNLSDEIWRMDFKNHKKGATYLELEKFIQAAIVYERNLHPKGECNEECKHYYSLTTPHNICWDKNCGKVFFPYIKGELYQCREMGSTVTACKDSQPRLYKYMTTSTTTYGKNDGCSSSIITFPKYGECSFCICNMYWPGRSSKAISMRAVYSNFAQNKVIVGVKFTKFNNILHFQVKEATLGPKLAVTNSSWVSIENFRETDLKILKNQDYFVPTLTDNAIHLADYKASEGQYKNFLLTGVRFFKWKGFLSLQIHLTRFNITSGKLTYPNGSSWYDIKDLPTDEIKIRNPDVPTKMDKNPEMKNNGNNQFVKFTHTSLESDFAQTTVPFFDAREVVSEGPLSGLGLYYKTAKKNNNEDFGGFLGIKLLTFNFTNFL